MRTDCFGIPGCSRVFWMSFAQHTQQDELARRFHVHDQFFGKVTHQYNNRWGTLYDHRSLVSGSLPQEFKLDTAFFWGFVSYHWGYTHARSCKIWDFQFKVLRWHSCAQLQISDFLFSRLLNLPFFLSVQKIAKIAKLAIFPVHWKIF